LGALRGRRLQTTNSRRRIETFIADQDLELLEFITRRRALCLLLKRRDGGLDLALRRCHLLPCHIVVWRAILSCQLALERQDGFRVARRLRIGALEARIGFNHAFGQWREGLHFWPGVECLMLLQWRNTSGIFPCIFRRTG
jgi:hypothetical protein